MKIKERALAILLSLVMMLAFMPALAFANTSWSSRAAQETVVLSGSTATDPGSAELEVVVDRGEYEGNFTYKWYKSSGTEEEDARLEGDAAKYTATSEGYFYCVVTDGDNGTSENPVEFTVEREPWEIDDYDDDVLFEDKPVTLTVPIKGSLYGLTYQWYRWDEENDKDVIIDGETANELTVTEEGDYSCKVSFAYDEDESQWASFSVRKDFPDDPTPDYYGVTIGGVWYELIDSSNESLGADASLYEAQGAVTIPANVKLSNGKVYPVRTIYGPCPEATSISLPNTVTWIVGEVGLTECEYDEDGELISYKVIPGFVIFGKTGSAAQTYAKKYGIKFRDLAAEKEAARQGTPDKSLPKVKIAKPKAAKKAATIKWKKLNKKQLKKSKAQKIEVWVCPNGAFGPNDTIMKTTGKKKASLKVKGLKKGTYFVKVRAIKYVGGTKMVGPWSNVKKVKIKK